MERFCLPPDGVAGRPPLGGMGHSGGAKPALRRVPGYRVVKKHARREQLGRPVHPGRFMVVCTCGSWSHGGRCSNQRPRNTGRPCGLGALAQPSDHRYLFSAGSAHVRNVDRARVRSLVVIRFTVVADPSRRRHAEYSRDSFGNSHHSPLDMVRRKSSLS